MIKWSRLIKGIKINIARGNVDVLVYTGSNRFGLGAIGSHPHQCRLCWRTLLIINYVTIYIIGIDTISGQHLLFIGIRIISVQLIIGFHIHKVDIVVMVDWIPYPVRP